MSVPHRSAEASGPPSGSPSRGGGPGLGRELHWAWRGVRGRGWRAALVVGMIALSLAANAMVFAVVDALVFDSFPFPGPDRIVHLQETLQERVFLTRDQATHRLDLWSRHTDVFSAVGGYQQKTVFLTNSGTAERVGTADITIGFLNVLGVSPGWGRGFLDGDDQVTPEFAAVISVGLARRYFGSPSAAVGKLLEATAGPHRVVGVMPFGFAYPAPNVEIWRAYDPAGPLARNVIPVRAMARIAPRLTVEGAGTRLAELAPAVGATLGLESYEVTLEPVVRRGAPGTRRAMLAVLLGAALCLLLAACANVASLELAASVGRARTHAVQLALGATRASLARVAAIEGVMLVALALAAGVALAWLAIELVAAELPYSMRNATQNRIALDLRAVGYTAIAASAAWVFAALSPMLSTARSALPMLLKLEDRATMASRAGSRLRQALTAGEVAVAVALIIGGLLYTRSYLAMLAVDKGFDSYGVAEVETTYPTDFFTTPDGLPVLVERMRSALVAQPGIQAATHSSAPPSLGDSPSRSALEIDGNPPLNEGVLVGAKWVDASYFEVVRMPVLSGRYFADDDDAGSVIVSETFAQRFWPGVDAVGRSFRRSPREPWHTVVGVVGDFRADRFAMPTVAGDRFFYYRLWQLPTGSRPVRARPADWVDPGTTTGFLNLLVRMDSPALAPTVLEIARSFDPRLRVSVELVDDIYARQHADTRLASRVVGAFSVLAFVVAIAGIYSLMAFLVSGRRREIGIRMALGASRWDVARLVMGSSAGLILVGAGTGTALVWIASRWIESQLFGISPTDPATYAAVVGAVMATACLATWHPARQATQVNPAVALRE